MQSNKVLTINPRLGDRVHHLFPDSLDGDGQPEDGD